MLGLKRGDVMLCEHEVEWEKEAQRTIARLKEILKDAAKSIEHVGSTAVPSIKAKPIIDIALAVSNFESILSFEDQLKDAGFYYRPNAQTSAKNQLLFACGSFYDGTGDIQTHFIHVVTEGSDDWNSYIGFRDYLNADSEAAEEYEKLKVSLASEFSQKNGRYKYLDGKKDFIISALKKLSSLS